MRSWNPFIIALRLLVSALLFGCGSEGGANATLREALTARGIDVTALFAPPSTEELSAMARAWSREEPAPSGIREETSFVLPSGDSMRVLSHLVGEQRHYGVVIVPAGEHEPGTLPVAINLVGFGREMLLDVPTDVTALDGRFVTLIPSFRGQELRFEGQSWSSDGDPYDQCEGGTDDALAFIEAALQSTPAASPSGLVALGGSRGGNVAMLLGVRRQGVRAVVELAGPTDYLRGELLDQPNLTALYANYFVRELLNGGTDVAEARRRMLACSPLHFAERLPPTQAHHGTDDLNVPLAQAELLAERMTKLGRFPPAFQLFVYEGADHQLAEQLPLIEERVRAFFQALD
ncbi:MAG: prolyl oligopeptidase family serine peptidase [Polyangiales bacterium]